MPVEILLGTNRELRCITGRYGARRFYTAGSRRVDWKAFAGLTKFVSCCGIPCLRYLTQR